MWPKNREKECLEQPVGLRWNTQVVNQGIVKWRSASIHWEELKELKVVAKGLPENIFEQYEEWHLERVSSDSQKVAQSCI